MERRAQVIDEITLPTFRAEVLCPEFILNSLSTTDDVLLVGAPPGVGKTYAAHGVIKEAYRRGHDLVVYIAPTRALIGELLDSGALDGLDEQTVLLERRPSTRCGPLDPEWTQLEKQGCGALGKASLCTGCVHASGCDWPNQFEAINEDTKLVVFTEAYLTIRPSLIQDLIRSANAQLPLVIFDEASILSANLVKAIPVRDIECFAEAVREVRRNSEDEHLIEVTNAIEMLLDGQGELATWPRPAKFDLFESAKDIQAAGNNTFGAAFRYVGHDLIELTSGYVMSRWFDDEAFHYVPVIDTRNARVLIFSPYLPLQIVEERLQRSVRPLFEDLVFKHSMTRVINIPDPVGAYRSISTDAHFKRVADFYLALALRDQHQRRRSVIVAKKRLVGRLKTYIETQSAALGRPLSCVGPEDVYSGADMTKINVAVINYGIVGVNSLEAFDAVYSFGGYYARQSQLEDTYNQALPPDDRIDLTIHTQGGRRAVQASIPDFRSRFHARRAKAVLEMIESRIVLQALGRVRPFTSPALVIGFQMGDLSGAFGDIESYGRLSRARAALCVPTLSELSRAALGDHLRTDRENGLSFRAIAEKHDLPLSNVYKALKSRSLDDLLSGIQL